MWPAKVFQKVSLAWGRFFFEKLFRLQRLLKFFSIILFGTLFIVSYKDTSCFIC